VEAGSGKPIFIDVHTPEEFMFVGHAEMARNIPLAAQSRQFPMRLPPDFVSRVKQVAKPDDTLLVMCRSGNRSAQTVNLLAEVGFRNVYNIMDGMEGWIEFDVVVSL
jgi:rhodanese-related sulfurtransferase